MRTDSKRSLLIWPVTASTAIVAGIWFHDPERLDSARRWAESVSVEARNAWETGPFADGVRKRFGERSESSSPAGVLTHLAAPRKIGRPDGPGAYDPVLRRDFSGIVSHPVRFRAMGENSGGNVTVRLAAPRREERSELAGMGQLTLVTPATISQPSLVLPMPDPGAELDIARRREAFQPEPSPLDEDAGFAISRSAQPDAAPVRVEPRPTPLRPESPASESPLAETEWTPAEATMSAAEPPSPKNEPPSPTDAAETPTDAAETSSDAAESSVAEAEARPVKERSPAAEANRPAWPTALQLERQLATLVKVASRTRRPDDTSFVSDAGPTAPETAGTAAGWTADVLATLRRLADIDRIDAPEAERWIGDLRQQGELGLRLAETRLDRDEQREWLRAAHAVNRRVAVWEAIWAAAAASAPESSDAPTGSPRTVASEGRQPTSGTPAGQASGVAHDLLAAVTRVRQELPETGDPEGWESYLLLPELEYLAGQTGAGARDPREFESLDRQRLVACQRLLSRLQWHGLDASHQAWLGRDSVRTLAATVRPWGRSVVDFAQLMGQIESQESDLIDLASLEIADAVQALRFADRPEALRVSEVIDTHYRNANVRIAVTAELLEALLPPVEPQTVPVRAILFGSRIRGVSRVESELRLRLLPARDRWSLTLQTVGDVRTASVGRNGPVDVRTAADSRFLASLPIEVTPDGVSQGDSGVQVNGNSRLRGIRTDYDGWPLIGSLVRGIAASRFEELKPLTDRYAARRVESQVGEEIETRVEEAIAEATSRMTRSLLGPLGQLNLDPMVVDMETTDRRLLARYRLAGDWQLAAFTPRPRAPSSSLMSVQIHQSAINNTLEQLAPREESRSIAGIVSEVLELFQRPGTAMPDDIPADVAVQFAPTRPVTVEIEDGLLWITMRIIRLHEGDRLDLRRFIVRAAYRPRLDGMEAVLEREGPINISGPAMSMRERLPVRAIFNKVFSPHRPLPLTHPALTEHPSAEKLVVSQFELRDGWIGIAISEQEESRPVLTDASSRRPVPKVELGVVPL